MFFITKISDLSENLKYLFQPPNSKYLDPTSDASVTVSPLNPSGYMRIRGSTETLICMDPLNWHRLNFI